MTDSQRLLAELNQASKLTGLKPSSLGKYGIGNGRIYTRLKAGSIVFPATAKRLRAYLAAEIKRRGAQSKAIGD